MTLLCDYLSIIERVVADSLILGFYSSDFIRGSKKEVYIIIISTGFFGLYPTIKPPQPRQKNPLGQGRALGPMARPLGLFRHFFYIQNSFKHIWNKQIWRTLFIYLVQIHLFIRTTCVFYAVDRLEISLDTEANNMGPSAAFVRKKKLYLFNTLIYK